MNKSKYNHASPLPPGRVIGNIIGGIAGGASGFLKARQEAKASGEKMTFKGAVGDVLLGAGTGALDPTGLKGITSLASQGLSTIKDDAQRNEVERAANAESMIAESQPVQAMNQPINDPMMSSVSNPSNAQNSSINPYPVFGGTDQQTMGGVFNTEQQTYGQMFA
jgi:hypothetical protein